MSTNIFKRYAKALHGAIGLKRYVVVGLAFSAIGLYAKFHSMLSLPELPSWEVGTFVVLAFLIGWLSSRIVELETSIAPSLEVVYEPGYPCEITDPMHPAGPAVRHIRLAVKNTGAQELSNCLVKLEDIKKDDGTNIGFYTPVGLRTQHQHLQQKPGGPFTLRPGERKLVELATLDERSRDTEIILQYETDEYPQPIPRGRYRLTIAAYGGPTPVEKKLGLFVDNEGVLKLESLPN